MPNKPKPKPEPKEPKEAAALEAPPVETPAPEVPAETQAAPSTSAKPVPEKVVHHDSYTEILVGYGEEEEQPDVPLPDMYKLLGDKRVGTVPIENNHESGYETAVMQAAGDVNLVWHPAIICGRCEVCGSMRIVGGEVWKRIDKKTGEVKYSYRGGTKTEIDATNCPHYRHIQITCGYCKEEFTGDKDKLGQFTQVLGDRNIWVVSEPSNPKRLIMVCSDYTCKHKFNQQFHINSPI